MLASGDAALRRSTLRRVFITQRSDDTSGEFFAYLAFVAKSDSHV